MRPVDLAVVGGGVLGLAIAHRAAREGLAVAVFERDALGAAASWAAAGMLCAAAEADKPGPFFDLLRSAARRYGDWVAEVEADGGLAVDYVRCGTWVVARTQKEAARVEDRIRWQTAAGVRLERIEVAEARRLEPLLAEDLVATWLYPDDHQVDNRRLVRALAAAAARVGARLLASAAVERVELGEDVALHLPDRRVTARRIVVATGAWPLRGLPRPLPVRPVRGQLLAVERVPPALHRIVVGSAGYLVPRPDGRVLLGTTVEEAGYRLGVTPTGLATILRGALSLAPALADAPVVETWSGLRPGSPDGWPILGPDPSDPRVFYAAGAFRNGILLAPLVAELGATWAAERPVPLDLEPFRIERFASGSTP